MSVGAGGDWPRETGGGGGGGGSQVGAREMSPVHGSCQGQSWVWKVNLVAGAAGVALETSDLCLVTGRA